MQEWLGELSNSANDYIQSVEPINAYLTLALTSLFENIFPPAPGDLITVFGASLVGSGHLSFVGVLISTTIGSVVGFMIYFYIGRRLGRKFFVEKDYTFFPHEQFVKTEEWFEKYGYRIVLGNRFLSGLRSVISLFCGVNQLDVRKILIYSTLSALAWNVILIAAGATLGSNWELIQTYLSQYAQIITTIIAVVLIIWFIRAKFMKKKNVN